MRRPARATLTFAALPTLVIFAACTERPTTDTPLGPNTLLPQVVAAAGESDLTQPLSGLTAAELSRFNQGRAVFERVFDSSTGLGPLFNSSSCAGCHEGPSVGGFGDDLVEDVETHVSTVTGGSCDDLSAFGGVVIQQHTTDLLFAASGATTEPVPSEATDGVGRRTTPALFGFGLLEAIPASAILALADPNDANGDGISGRAHMVGGQPGRFGRKATDPDLLGFNAGAFMMEMGLTNQFQTAEQKLVGFAYPYPFPAVDPVAGLELSNADLALATDFVRFLAPPQALKLTGDARDGIDLFAKVGCAACHVPSLTTGNSPIKALDRKPVAAFTDLLLHDMGSGLADICRGDASPVEFRTEPLMGLRFREHFLHDARSASVEDAILQHGGEATGSVNKFNGLKANQKAALLAYLSSL
jgi:CxxC motif-containing protein (DUF1111 family)